MTAACAIAEPLSTGAALLHVAPAQWPETDRRFVAGLSDAGRQRLRVFLGVFREIEWAGNVMAACRAIAARLHHSRGDGFSAKRLECYFYLFKRDGLRTLPLGSVVRTSAPRDAVDHLHGWMQHNKRSGKQGWRDAREAWAGGADLPGIGRWEHVFARRFPHRAVPRFCPIDDLWPAGLGYENLIGKLDPVQTAAARRGVAAALALLPSIPGTRQGMRPLEWVTFDDVTFAPESYVDVLDGSGVRIFRGCVVPTSSASKGKQRKIYSVAGGWNELETRQYMEPTAMVDIAGNPTTTARILALIQEDTGHGIYMDIGGMVTGIVNWAVGTGGAPLQLGNVDERHGGPAEAYQDVTCAEAITRSARWDPGSFITFDYSTNPPALNSYASESTAPVTIPVTAFTDVPKIDRSWERQVGMVAVRYHTGGLNATFFGHQILSAQYPAPGPGVPTFGQKGAVVFTLDDIDRPFTDVAPLCQAMYEGLNKWLWKGSAVLKGPTVPGQIFVGNLLNISGGNVAWAAMNGYVQRVTDDLEKGERQIEWGPPPHLSAGDLSKLLNINRSREPARPDMVDAQNTGKSQSANYGFGGDQVSTGVPKKGATGPRGPTGPTGARGPTGPTGARGKTGTRGATGTAGAPGAAGTKGPGGTKGPTGTRGPQGPTGTRGPSGVRGGTGPAGATGPGPRGPTGPAGAPGPSGPPGAGGGVGPTGPGHTGPAGPTGPIGHTGAVGLTGPKASVIKTPRGNIVLACQESSRPYITDRLRGCADDPIALRVDWLACAAPGSVFVSSLVSDLAGPLAAWICDDAVHVDGPRGAHINVEVCGIHRDFPGARWDLRRVDEDQRQRSFRFWQQEWRGK